MHTVYLLIQLHLYTLSYTDLLHQKNCFSLLQVVQINTILEVGWNASHSVNLFVNPKSHVLDYGASKFQYSVACCVTGNQYLQCYISITVCNINQRQKHVLCTNSYRLVLGVDPPRSFQTV